MLKRTVDEKDRVFVEITISIFRHLGNGLVEAAVVGSIDSDGVSLPSDNLKADESFDECVDNILKNVLCEDYESQLMSVMHSIKSVSRDDDKVMVSYRVDIPKVHTLETKLSWLSLEELVELNTDSKNLISDSHRKILIGCI